MKVGNEHFVTCGQMKVLERRADENGLSYYQMMENAGTGAAQMIMQKAAEKVSESIASYQGKSVAVTEESNRAYIFCGKGNNGGDGFVVARLMHDNGYGVTVVLVDGEPKTEDARTNLKLVRDRNIKVLNMKENDRALMELDGTPNVIVDAIYGTGFKGKLESNGLKSAIYINKFGKGNDDRLSGEADSVLVVSLDIPSGLGGDLVEEKDVETNSIRAQYTLTFHAKKPVHLQKFSKEYCGEIHVVDIGIDEEKLWNVEV